MQDYGDYDDEVDGEEEQVYTEWDRQEISDYKENKEEKSQRTKFLPILKYKAPASSVIERVKPGSSILNKLFKRLLIVCKETNLDSYDPDI